MTRYPQAILVACPSPWDDAIRAGRGDLPRGGPRGPGGRLPASLRLRDGRRGLRRRHRAASGRSSTVFYEETPGARSESHGRRHRALDAADRRADRVRPRRRLPDVPDLAAVVGPAQRRRAAAVLHGRVRSLPGLALPPLQPAANQAGAGRPRLRPDHSRGAQPGRDQDDRRRDRRRGGADPLRG